MFYKWNYFNRGSFNDISVKISVCVENILLKIREIFPCE